MGCFLVKALYLCYFLRFWLSLLYLVLLVFLTLIVPSRVFASDWSVRAWQAGAWQSPRPNAKRDCSATFQGRAILCRHEAKASHYVLCLLICHFAFWLLIFEFLLGFSLHGYHFGVIRDIIESRGIRINGH